MMELIIPCMIGLLCVLVARTTDPCDTTNFLNDWRRSVAVTNDYKLCDNLLTEDWYRVLSRSGTKMPTVCPKSFFACGTTGHIWLSNESVPNGEDIYPAVGKTVKRKAYKSSYEGCNLTEYNISIKNCDGYYVHYLVPTGGCFTSYCFGDQLPCPDGQSSETGFTPGCGPYPELVVSPYITTQLEETQGSLNGKDFTFSRVTFQCHADDLSGGYVYEIRWYISEFEIVAAKSNNLSKSEVENGYGKMLEEHWQLLFTPNFLVKCSFKVRGSGFKSPGPEQYSQPFFAGIKIDQTEYIINENEELSIPVELTMPLSCSWPSASDQSQIDYIKDNICILNLLNAVPTYQIDGSYCKNGISAEGLVFRSEQCGIVFTFKNWTAAQYVHVTGASDGQINIEDNIIFLRLFNDPNRTRPSKDSLKVWTGIHLIDIKVVIHDTDEETLGKECYALNDPHMRTFGERKYELQNLNGLTAGEYIMYKHARLPLQVNAFFKRCNSRSSALCNCGVAVRSGDSLFVTNFCETELTNGERRTNNYIIQRLCDDQNLIIEETGDKFKIILPSGTNIKFSHTTSNAGKHTIQQISIFPSSLDLEMTSGLCGVYTGKKDDSLIPRNSFSPTDPVTFAKSWKVENEIQDLTLFDPEGKLKQTKYSVPEYCTCKLLDDQYPHTSPEFSCTLSAAMKTCRSLKRTTSVYKASCRNRVFFSERLVGRAIKEEITNEAEEDDDKPTIYPMTSDSSVDSSVVAEWSNGWTYETARELCTASIYNAPAFGPCSQYVPFMDPEAYINDCILDIKYEGNSTWIKSTLEGFADVCLEKAQKLENLTKTNDTTSSGEGKSIFALISESTCADNCSGHGQCVDGKKFALNCLANRSYAYFSPSRKTKRKIYEFTVDDIFIVYVIVPLGIMDHLVRMMHHSHIRNAFEGVCDTTKKPCKKFIIPGSNFIDDSNLTCQFLAFKIMTNSSSSTVEFGEIFVYPGKFRSSFFMNCELPETQRRRSVDESKVVEGYHVSVSNNGQVFTQPLTVIIFNSLCFKCNLTELLCDELDTCPQKQEEPTSSKDSKSKYLAIYFGVPIAVVFLIVIFVCLRKKLRPRQQQPYVDTYFSSLQTRGNGPGNSHFQAEHDYL